MRCGISQNETESLPDQALLVFSKLCVCVGVHSGCTDCQNAFALVVRPPTEQENLLFSFQLTAEDTLKSTWLKTLCRQVANTICRADAVSAVPPRGIFLGPLRLEADKASSIIIYFIRPHFVLLQQQIRWHVRAFFVAVNPIRLSSVVRLEDRLM